LSAAEAEVWAAITESLPADWFGAGQIPLLAGYCRHVGASNRIARMIEQAMSETEINVRALNRLLIMQARESAALASLGTKLRLTVQSTRTRRGNPIPVGTRPWE
jgi:hypothetical protein